MATDSADNGTNTVQGSLDDLLACTLPDAAAARQAVEQGDYAVAVIIPPGFTQSMMPSFGAINQARPAGISQIEVYGNSGDVLSSRIVNSIVSVALPTSSNACQSRWRRPLKHC
ncbi:MAG: hypothetical protein R2932_25245 [Caldilineaceae bacterium]